MDIEIDPRAEIHRDGNVRILTLHLVFSTDPDALQSITAVRVTRFRFAGQEWSEAFFDRPTVHPAHCPDQSISLPMQLRPEDSDGHDFIDLQVRLPGDLPIPESQESVEIDLAVVFRRIVDIQLFVRGVASQDLSAFTQLECERGPRNRRVLTNVAMVAVAFALLVGWRQRLAETISVDGYLGSEQITHILFFMTGFFGFPILNLVLKACSSLKRLVSVWKYPELYLSRDLVRAFRSRLLTHCMSGALVVLLCAMAWHASVRLENPDPKVFSWLFADSRVLTSSRLFPVWESQKLKLLCGDSSHDANRYVARASLLTPLRYLGAIPFPTIGASWRRVRISFPADFDIPSDCATDPLERSDRRAAWATLSKEFDDPCFDGLGDRVKAAFCSGESDAAARTRVSLIDEELVVSLADSFDLAELRTLMDDYEAMARKTKGSRRTLLRKEQKLAERFIADHKVDGERRIPGEVFMSYYRSQLAEFKEAGVERAARHMMMIIMAARLHAQGLRDLLDEDDLEEIAKDFRVLYPRPLLRQSKTADGPDKTVFRAHVRLLLALERQFGALPEFNVLSRTIDSQLEETGWKWYLILLEETLHEQAISAGPDGASPASARREFFLRNFGRVASMVPSHRATIDDLKKEWPKQTEAHKLLDELSALARVSVAVADGSS